MTYNLFDVIVVPFPFTDRTSTKKRPALVISSHQNFNYHANHLVCTMITDARHDRWPLDSEISGLVESGLSKPSIIRFKLFTLDEHLVIRSIGQLGKNDQVAFKKNLKLLMS